MSCGEFIPDEADMPDYNAVYFEVPYEQIVAEYEEVNKQRVAHGMQPLEIPCPS